MCHIGRVLDTKKGAEGSQEGNITLVLKVIKDTMTKAEEIIARLTDCSDCAGHNDHDVCRIDWLPLQDWMEAVNQELDKLRDQAGRVKPPTP